MSENPKHLYYQDQKNPKLAEMNSDELHSMSHTAMKKDQMMHVLLS